jgi:small subunit ribosomal protein S7
MSRKKTQPKKNVVPDPKFNSTIIPKLINNIMYDGKRGVAAKIVYDAIEKIKTKSKDEPINIFNEAINNIKPTVEVRSRRVGGATYQVPVEVKSKRAQALAIRWLVDSARKRKDKHMSDKILMNCLMLMKKKVQQLKKERMCIKWLSQTKLLHILDGNKKWLELIH